MRGRFKTVSLLLVALASLSACRDAAGPEIRAVILITLDTTRGDRFDWDDAQALPHMKRLFADGARFEQAITGSPVTAPSHVTILTGLSPAEHQIVVNGMTLPDESTTLAERLSGAGFGTAGFVSCSLLGREFGFDQGFDHFDDEQERLYHGRAVERPADSTTDRALAWLRENDGQPFFLWVHYFDPHAPYDPPATHRPAGFDDLEADPGLKPSVDQLQDIHRFQVDLPPRIRDYYGALYDGELAFVDEQIGRLVAYLEQRPYFENSLIVMTADHGEELGDHRNFYEHNRSLYDGVMRVPLAVRGPGIAAGRVAEQVSNGSIVATVLERLNLEVPVGLIPGALAEGREDDPRAQTCMKEPIPMLDPWGVALRRPPLKLIWWEHGERELYDLSADPAETRNLAESRSADALPLQEMIEQNVIAAFAEHAFPEDFGTPPDAETLEVLRSLGYVD